MTDGRPLLPKLRFEASVGNIGADDRKSLFAIGHQDCFDASGDYVISRLTRDHHYYVQQRSLSFLDYRTVEPPKCLPQRWT